MRSSGSLWSQDSFRSHASLYISFGSKVTGEMVPTGSCIDAKNFSIRLFFYSKCVLTLFNDTLNISHSDVLVLKFCFSKEMSGFVTYGKLSSFFTFECHLCNLNFPSPNSCFLNFLIFFNCSATSNQIINI